MKMKVFSIFDSCAGVYDRPFVAHNEAAATRAFGDIAISAEHAIGQHPEHYSLYLVGEWDDNNAVIKPEDRVCIATALELIAKAQKVTSGALKEFDEDIVKIGGTA